VLGGPDYDGRDETALARLAPAGPKAAGLRGSTSGCPGFASLRFEPLAAAEAEALEVESMWQSGRGRSAQTLTLVGTRAIEEAFKQMAPLHQVVHIATHGFFLDNACGPGATDLPENPLLRSGLAFAGANRRAAPASDRDDGILTAEEIASLDLSGVDWLVLSACDTALGSLHSGEGVLGLRRACRVAGAGTVIMSLWKVQDEAARGWMRRLYQRRLAGLSADEAVRRAGLDTLAARRRARQSTHPFYWGAFVAVGDWR
jgi:CHAT domain-containing protein